MGLPSLVTLLAHQLDKSKPLLVLWAAWYVKQWPPFSDALATVRHRLWYQRDSHTPLPDTDMVKMPRSVSFSFIDTLLRIFLRFCYLVNTLLNS